MCCFKTLQTALHWHVWGRVCGVCVCACKLYGKQKLVGLMRQQRQCLVTMVMRSILEPITRLDDCTAYSPLSSGMLGWNLIRLAKTFLSQVAKLHTQEKRKKRKNAPESLSLSLPDTAPHHPPDSASEWETERVSLGHGSLHWSRNPLPRETEQSWNRGLDYWLK